MLRNFFIIPAAVVLLLSSCTFSPKYSRPEAPVPDQWPSGPAYQSAPESEATPANTPWRVFIGDEKLRLVIEMALNNNRDFRIAALNVEKARALYGIQRAELLPAVRGVGSWYKERIPADLSASRQSMTVEQYSVDLGITAWEIDFFGRIRSLKENALEQYLATNEARRSAQILLLSTTAQAYLTLAADREALEIVSATLEAQNQTFGLIKKRYAAGVSSELDLRRAQSQVETARGDVAKYMQIVAQDENALNLVVGAQVPADLLPRALNTVAQPKQVSAGLSSLVLLERPDVLAAEHRLKAANANIGAARAAFFPRISLTSSLGTASVELSGLFASGSGTWVFAPLISLPIFDARTWPAYRVSKVEKELSIAQYEKAIQAAFRDVSDALAVNGAIAKRIEAQQALVDALAEAYRLATLRYDKGIDSYLSVLDAQRQLYGARQGLVSLQLLRHVNLVTIYGVLGGGADNA